MKYPQSTILAQAGSELQEISQWPQQLRELHSGLRPHFARPEVHAQVLGYLHAVLSDIPRKNCWQIAEQVRQEHPYRMQRLLSHSVWDEDAVRDAVRTLVCRTLSPPPLLPATADHEPLYPVFVLDESGFPKRGSHSAGVAPQYCGRTGRVENCQVGVFLSLVTELGHGLIDRELYLPEEWCADQPRRQGAHIPDALTFHTKPEQGIRMLERGQAAGQLPRWGSPIASTAIVPSCGSGCTSRAALLRWRFLPSRWCVSRPATASCWPMLPVSQRRCCTPETGSGSVRVREPKVSASLTGPDSPSWSRAAAMDDISSSFAAVSTIRLSWRISWSLPLPTHHCPSWCEPSALAGTSKKTCKPAKPLDLTSPKCAALWAGLATSPSCCWPPPSC